VQRAVRRAVRRATPGRSGIAGRAGIVAGTPRRLERGRFLALDALLSAEELAGFVLSNRPRVADGELATIQAVLVAERFPVAGDPLVELARTLGQVRVEAAARPTELDRRAAQELSIVYREDDGTGARGVAVARLLIRHPVRCLRDVVLRVSGQPPLRAIAPAAMRIARQPGARVLALGGSSTATVAERLARLSGRALEETRRGSDQRSRAT
jgi:hypothetical protein